MTVPSNDAFYGLSDSTANRAPANNPDLTNQVGLDGTRPATTNTGNRYLTHVGITDNGSGTTNGKPGDCDYISTKFNAHKDATYEVTIRDGKIYINTGNGDQVTQPQLHHPANIALQQARDNDYYNTAGAPPPVEALPPAPQYAAYPPNEGFYPPPLPMPYREHWGGYPHREPWGYAGRGYEGRGYEGGGRINPVGAVFGALLGGIEALAGGRNYYPPEGAGYGYYRPAPVGYMPIQQASFNYQGNNGGYYASNYAPSYSRGYSPGYTPASSYDQYANNNQQNDDSFYFS
jgi:hypothetical protein